MTSIIYNLIFLFCTIYILLKVLGYAIYEIRTLKNKSGGITIICFSIIVVIFSNVMLFVHNFKVNLP